MTCDNFVLVIILFIYVYIFTQCCKPNFTYVFLTLARFPFMCFKVISSHYNDAVLIYVVKIRLKEYALLYIICVCCTHMCVYMYTPICGSFQYLYICCIVFECFVYMYSHGFVCIVFMFNGCILAVFFVLENIESHVAYLK